MGNSNQRLKDSYDELYSNSNNYTLWLDYNPSYNDLYYDNKYGLNAFEYYFNAIVPDWNICDNHHKKLI